MAIQVLEFNIYGRKTYGFCSGSRTCTKVFLWWGTPPPSVHLSRHRCHSCDKCSQELTTRACDKSLPPIWPKHMIAYVIRQPEMCLEINKPCQSVWMVESRLHCFNNISETDYAHPALSIITNQKLIQRSEVKELSTLSGPLLQGCCSEASRVFSHWQKWKSSEIKGKALLGCLATCMYTISFNMNITIVFQGSWTMQLWTQGEPGIFSHASDVKGRPFILITWVMSGGCMVDVWGEGEFHLQTMH